jgi:hypothetical protein
MSTSDENALKVEAYRVAKETRNLEISLFWQRSNYFLVLSTAIAAGFFSLKDGRYGIPLALMGVLVSVLWVCVNLGSKFWQSRWEYRLQVAERDLRSDMNLFAATWETVQQDVRQSLEFRKRGRIHRLYSRAVLLKPSVTMMMTLLSVGFVLFWIAVLVISILPTGASSDLNM